MATGQVVVEVSPLDTQEKVRAAVELQKRIWGFDDVELLPIRLFVTAMKIGGQAFGAFDGEKLVGFCLSIPGIRPSGLAYLHSHMLGVAPEYRDCGIGRMLKLKQREEALARPLDLMEWTFDPLELKNAYFNLERLGAIVRRYVRNQYGTTSSHLHGGLPTDRCTAEWWLDSARVIAAIEGRPLERPPVEAVIAVPNDIAEIRREAPRQAREVQARIGQRFEDYFLQGLAVVGFEKTAETGNYLIGKWL